MFPLESSQAATTNVGTDYVLDCADGTVNTTNLPNTSSYTVQIQNCAYYLASGSGVSPTGNNYNGGAVTNYTVSAGAIGEVRGYNAGVAPAGASQRLLFAAPANTAPAFVAAGAGTLVVAQGAAATDIKGLLHVSDSDSSQTLTWTQSAAPSHGTLSFSSATASSGSTDINPGGTITYVPAAGYAGPDSFTVQVSDGTASATRVINVTVNPPTVTVNALVLNGMTVGTPYVTQTFAGAGGYDAYTYTVSAGTLPAGLSLNSATGALSGTPTTAAAYNFTIQATDSSTGTGPFSGTRAFSAAVNAAPIPVTPPGAPIPNSVAPPAIGAITSRPTVLDLGSGEGPTMTTCLRDTLQSVLGANAQYLGQRPDGSARIGQTGQVASFYVLDASRNIQTPGISPGVGNPLDVYTGCGTFNVIPAVYSLGEFGSRLTAMGLAAQVDAQGVMTIPAGNTVYVARPDYLVSNGKAGAPTLAQGADGLYRFTDSAGNIQLLRPAFLETDVLYTQLILALPGVMRVQTDGTVLFTTLDRRQYVLTPDLTLSNIPAANASMAWWQDAPDHYMVRLNSYPSKAQGFTVNAR